jgi:hypothetical protein
MTPETTALVQQLLARAWKEGCAWAYQPHERGETPGPVDAAEICASRLIQQSALSQGRTCSTCRHFERTAGPIIWKVCQHPDSPLRELGTQRPETFGCLLWEQADPKEPA